MLIILYRVQLLSPVGTDCCAWNNHNATCQIVYFSYAWIQACAFKKQCSCGNSAVVVHVRIFRKNQAHATNSKYIRYCSPNKPLHINKSASRILSRTKLNQWPNFSGKSWDPNTDISHSGAHTAANSARRSLLRCLNSASSALPKSECAPLNWVWSCWRKAVRRLFPSSNLALTLCLMAVSSDFWEKRLRKKK